MQFYIDLRLLLDCIRIEEYHKESMAVRESAVGFLGGAADAIVDDEVEERGAEVGDWGGWLWGQLQSGFGGFFDWLISSLFELRQPESHHSVCLPCLLVYLTVSDFLLGFLRGKLFFFLREKVEPAS
jgi:hypothetical protein